MTRVFIDTGAFVAKQNARDQFHRAAIQGWEKLADLPVRWVTSEHVLDEAATLLARDTTYRYAANWLYETLETGEVDWLPSAPRDWAVAAKLMIKYADQQISFTDCLSFALMKRERIRYVFTFDRHFSYAGFQLFPERDFAR